MYSFTCLLHPLHFFFQLASSPRPFVSQASSPYPKTRQNNKPFKGQGATHPPTHQAMKRRHFTLIASAGAVLFHRTLSLAQQMAFLQIRSFLISCGTGGLAAVFSCSVVVWLYGRGGTNFAGETACKVLRCAFCVLPGPSSSSHQAGAFLAVTRACFGWYACWIAIIVVPNEVLMSKK